MKIDFFTQIVENFFENPGYVRELGLSSTKNLLCLDESKGLFFRGKRSAHMSGINDEIYKKITIFLGKSYLKSHFVETEYKDIQCSCEFQLTDGTWSEGWVHFDSSLITSIIYLNPIAPVNSGTNIYVPKHRGITQLHSEYHKKTNASPKLRDTEEYAKKRKENNDQFMETTSVQNVYNRLVSFFGRQWHCGANHFGNTDDTSRLTIVTQIFSFGKSFNP